MMARSPAGQTVAGRLPGHWYALAKPYKADGEANRAQEREKCAEGNDKSLGGFVARGAGLVVRDDGVAAGHLKYIAAVGARWDGSPNLRLANLLSAWNGRGSIRVRDGVRALINHLVACPACQV